MSKPRTPSAASAAVAATVSPSQSMVGDATSTPLSNWALVVKNGAPSADLSLAARRTLNQIRTEWLQRTHTARGTHGFAWLSKYVEVDLGFPVHVISRSSHRTIAIVGSGSETESFIAPARASDAARCSVDASAAFVTLATLVPRHHRSPEHVWHQVRALQRHFTLSAHQAARNPDAEYDDNGGRVSLLALAAAVLCGIGAHCLSLEECARLLAEELEYLLALSVTCNGPDQQHWDQQTRRTGLDEYSSLFHEWAASANAATQLAFNKSNASMNSDSGILDLMVRQGTAAATQSGSHASANILNRHSSNTNVRRRRNSSIFPMSFDATSGAVPGPTTASSTSLSPDHANRPSSSHHSPPNFNSGINGPTSSSAAAADGTPVDWRRVQWTCLLPPVKGSRAEPLYHLLEARRHDFIPPSLTYVVASSYAPESPRAGPQRTPSTSGLPRPSSSSSVPRQSSPSHSHSPPRPSSSGDLVTPRAGSSSHLHGLPPAHSSGHHHQHQQQSAFETMVTAALSSSMTLNASANTEGGNRSVTPSEWRDAVTRTATCVMLPGIPSTYLVKNYVQHLGFDARYRFRSTVAALAALAKDYDCGRIGSDAITPWSGPREYSLAISAKLRLSLQLPLDRHCVLLAPYGTAQQPVAGVSHGLDDNGSARTGTGRTDGTEVHHRRGLTRKDTEGSIDPEMASSWEGSFGPGGRSGIGLGVGSISIQDKGETDHVDVDDDSESIYDQETKTIPRPDRGSAYTRNRRGEGTVAAGVDVVGPTGACCGGGCLVM